VARLGNDGSDVAPLALTGSMPEPMLGSMTTTPTR